MVLMIAAMVFDFIPIPPVAAVIIAGILMVLTGCFRNVEEAYKTINWESVVLIAAMLPMSLALEKTGASNLISGEIGERTRRLRTARLDGRNLFHHLATDHVYQQHGHGGTGSPIALQSAIAINVSPYPFLLAVTVGASMCFASPPSLRHPTHSLCPPENIHLWTM